MYPMDVKTGSSVLFVDLGLTGDLRVCLLWINGDYCVMIDRGHTFLSLFSLPPFLDR